MPPCQPSRKSMDVKAMQSQKELDQIALGSSP